MLMNVCPLVLHVMTQSDYAMQPVPGCGMLHNPVQAVATQQLQQIPKQVAQYVASMLLDINVPG
jgi:hypothetical protein